MPPSPSGALDRGSTGAHTPRRALAGILRRSGQQVVDAPAKAGRLVGLLSGEIGNHAAHDRPGELRRLLEAHVGRDSELARQLQREPSPDGGMRNDDPFEGERVARIRAHEVRELARERFQPVRVVQPHAGGHFPAIRDRNRRAPEADVMGAPGRRAGRSRRGVGIGFASNVGFRVGHRGRVSSTKPSSGLSPVTVASRVYTFLDLAVTAVRQVCRQSMKQLEIQFSTY